MPIPGFRSVPRTGVIYVMHEAARRGFGYGRPDWANLGQGSPECGALPGAPPRIERIRLGPGNHQYAPIQGHTDLREAVADYYNTTFRRGMASRYSAENVSIASGGRLALTRLAASLGPVNMGHFIPDYTAYEELLGIFRSFIPIPILLDPAAGYRISPAELEKEVRGRELSVLLVSNPCNPTGQATKSEELAQWCGLARKHACTMIMDEFYSHFLFGVHGEQVSAAAFVEDVDRDPVIIVDGLTKNWRYPGWRLSWTIGPKSAIEAIASAGSFLDGGANHAIQEAAVPLLDPELARRETRATQRHFGEKRERTLNTLAQLGIEVEAPPQGTFYVWADLSRLPPPLDDGMAFFREGLKERVITVPGIFFDVNPGNRRAHARFEHYSRISFGPEPDVLGRGLAALDRVIQRWT